jgi:hypothetical protein
MAASDTKKTYTEFQMRWIVIFEDSTLMQQVRRNHEADNFAYLRACTSELLMAGSFRGARNQLFWMTLDSQCQFQRARLRNWETPDLPRV